MADILSFQETGHGRMKQLLPWYANGTLDAAERATVESHLQTCEVCRAEVDDLRAVADLLERESADAAAEAAFTRIRGRLDEPLPRSPWGALRDWFQSRGTPVLLAAQFIAVIGLSVALWQTDEQADPLMANYRTLSADGRVASARIFAKFDPARPESDMREALVRAGTRIVDGPTPEGLYVLEATTDSARALAVLKSARVVTSAESVEVR